MLSAAACLAAAVLVSRAAAAGAPAAAEAPVAATWQKHETVFTYMGFTSHYSCGGLEDTLTFLLRLAGARSDAKVRAACTSPMGGPQRISTANLTFYTLAPVSSGNASAAGSQAVSGAWKSVKLRAGSPTQIGGGDCELVEQFARDLLPMFTTRNVENRMTCVPREANLFGIDLQFGVLAPLPQPKKVTLRINSPAYRPG